MKWRQKRRSTNVEDRRGNFSKGSSNKSLNPMLIGLLLKLISSKKGLLLVVGIVAVLYFTGNNPLQFFTNSPNTNQNTSFKGSAQDKELAELSTLVLGSTENVWGKLIKGYRPPKLVLFTGFVKSACGSANSASGPFYCPADEKLYIDLSFFKDMAMQLNAPGDFAQAYVIAHEVGHHIQHLMGTTDKLHNLRGKISQKEYNKYSVMLELQADFYAGVWAHHSQNMNLILEDGDIEEALNAAKAVGDDRLQQQQTGTVVPDSFTHGTSAQRMRWFKKGLDSGNINLGNTFTAKQL